jgi:hypothetical protein
MFIWAILAYAGFGNIAAYLIMNHRDVPMKSIWAGTPGYLYRVCRTSDVEAGSAAKFLALTSSLAFLIGFPWAVITLSMVPYS